MNMNVMKFEKYGTHIGIVKSRKVLIQNEHDFVDFLTQAMQEADANNIILEKTALSDDFFDPNTGLADVINKRLINYRARLAIVGDFKQYEDEEFLKLIQQNNEAGDLSFLRSVNEAVTFFAG